MGYNRENFRRIKREYEGKSLKAKEEAERRAEALRMQVPELALIDAELSKTAMRIYEAAQTYRGQELEDAIARLKKEIGEYRAEREKLLLSLGYAADYTDPKYECPLCMDSGTYRMRICKCMREKLVMAGYESSGIARLMETQTFETFDPSLQRDRDRYAAILGSAKAFVAQFDGKSGKNLLLMGATGLGKTHISTAIAKSLIENGYDVVYETATNLFSDYEAERFSPHRYESSEPRVTERYTECDLLIIDDLGSEMSNQFTVSVLYNLLNTRINRGQSLLISTNLSPEEMRRRYTDRITSRLLGNCILLQFPGEDIRMKKLTQMP